MTRESKVCPPHNHVSLRQPEPRASDTCHVIRDEAHGSANEFSATAGKNARMRMEMDEMRRVHLQRSGQRTPRRMAPSHLALRPRCFGLQDRYFCGCYSDDSPLSLARPPLSV